MQFTAPLPFGTSRVPNPFLLFLPVFVEESPAKRIRYSNRPDWRREVRARRHPIPNPVEIVLQVLLEHLDRLSIDASCSVVRLDPSVGLPNHPLGNTKRLRVARRLLPRARLTVGTRWMTRPLCSIELPRLHRSYGSLRPCASHRASHPWGSAPWISPFTSRRQVPRSTQGPGAGSRHLYAGCRPAKLQAPAGLVPG